MLAVPHGHADVRAERSCTVCQVVRAGGAPVEPVATVSAPVPAPPALLAETALARGPEAAPLLGPSPPRGPPAPPRTS